MNRPAACSDGGDAAAPTIGERAFLWLQHLLPRRRLSALTYRLTRSRQPWLKNLLIGLFRARYRIRLDEARIKNPRDYASFNEFFVRALDPQARPLPEAEDAVVSPVDGRLHGAEVLDGAQLVQAKGHRYTLAALLGAHPRWQAFAGGQAVTIYLAPSDYHRVHMPLDGVLAATSHIPGDRFSVDRTTARHLPGLFTRNERLACHFDTRAGPLAVVLVGALNVGSIATVWAGEMVNRGEIRHRAHSTDRDRRIALRRGDELGRFNLGSTVIVLLPPGAAELQPPLAPGRRLRMGEIIARLTARRE